MPRLDEGHFPGVSAVRVFEARHWFVNTRDESVRIYRTLCVVSLAIGGTLRRSEFRREWVRVEPGAADNALIALSGQGRTVLIWRFVRPELRPVLACEIRMALRGA